MATGAPGTNGVWQYGEDDSEATFSALLNKAASTTDTQIGADRTRLTALEARKLSGLVPVVPSVTSSFSGGSGSINTTTGKVTFTGVTAIQLNTIFTSAFDNYRIVMNYKGTASGDLIARVSSSGTPVATSTYYTQLLLAAGTSVTAIQNAGVAQVERFGNTDTSSTSQTVDIFSPAKADRTSFIIHLAHPATQFRSLSSFNSNSTAYDGLYILATSGNFTGTMTVYGYNN